MAKKEPWNPLLKHYPESEKIRKISFEAETLYTRLLAMSDDNANYYGNPKLLLCGPFKLRFADGMADVKMMERLRNELEAVNLIRMYKSGDEPYLHITRCKKHIRPDIPATIEFPEQPQEFDIIDVMAPIHNRNVSGTDAEQNRNVSDTEPERTRNKNLPSYTTPTPNTNSDSNTNPNPTANANSDTTAAAKPIPSSLSGGVLELDLKIKESRDRCASFLNSSFIMNQRERVTFAAILKFITNECQQKRLTPKIFDDVVLAGQQIKTTGATNKKAFLVKKIQELTGYKGHGMILVK